MEVPEYFINELNLTIILSITYGIDVRSIDPSERERRSIRCMGVCSGTWKFVVDAALVRYEKFTEHVRPVWISTRVG